MGINIKTPAIHHISLRVSDFERAKNFYINVLGFPMILDNPGLFMFTAGTTVIGIRSATEEGKFTPLKVGMDHLALGCEDEVELERVAKALSDAGIENTGIKLEEAFNTRYIAFKDPDRIAWELYMV